MISLKIGENVLGKTPAYKEPSGEFNQYTLETENVRSCYAQLRKTEKPTGRFFLGKLIMDVGNSYKKSPYPLNRTEFDKVYNSVFRFVDTSPNLKRIIEQYNLETDRNSLWLWYKENT